MREIVVVLAGLVVVAASSVPAAVARGKTLQRFASQHQSSHDLAYGSSSRIVILAERGRHDHDGRVIVVVAVVVGGGSLVRLLLTMVRR